MKYILIFVVAVLIISCGDAGAGKVGNSAAPVSHASPPVPVPLSEIDLTRIGHIAPKGRVQDAEYNQLPIVEELIAHGKESIPFLISKLEDETKIDSHVLDFWYQVYVGDVALVILSDFFLDKNWERSTIAGMHWNELLGAEITRKLPARKFYGTTSEDTEEEKSKSDGRMSGSSISTESSGMSRSELLE